VRLLWIEVRDFRNHRELTLEVPPGLTVVVGPNGRGKTNLLEAAHYLCTLTSPRVSTDLPLVRVGASSAFLRGEAEAEGARFLVEVEVRASGQNRVQVNRSPVRRKRDLRRHLRSVFSGPDDLHVVQGDPSERRRFLDECVRTLWPAREGLPAAYERALRQRNRLLKDAEGGGPPAGMEAWDEELIAHGLALTRARARAAEAVRDAASGAFAALAGQDQDVLVVTYVPSAGPLDAALSEAPEALEDAFRERMASRRADELIRRTSLVGPHRDELELRVEGLVARGFASHGEAWGSAIALRLGLASAVERDLGEAPLLILDDPFSGLDPERRRRLSAGLEGRGQVLIAVPDDAHIAEGASVWRVGEGVVAER
jgi:DNA replication and repair protein RecF